MMNDPSPRALTFFAKKIPELCAAASGPAGLHKVTWVSLGDGPEKERGTNKQTPLDFPFAALSVEESSQQGNTQWFDVTFLAQIHNKISRQQIDPDAKSPSPTAAFSDPFAVRQQNLWLGAAMLFELGEWTSKFEKGIVLPNGVGINGIGQATNRPDPQVIDQSLYTQEVRWVITARVM